MREGSGVVLRTLTTRVLRLPASRRSRRGTHAGRLGEKINPLRGHSGYLPGVDAHRNGGRAAHEKLSVVGVARDYWRRALEVNPFGADSQVHLVTLLIRAGSLDEAQKHCEQLLRLDPFNISGRQALVGLLLQKGQRDEARRAFDIIRQLKPPDLAQREEWFRQLLSEPRP